MGRKRFYPDDVLIHKPIRLSEKYEIQYIKMFIDLLRSDKRELAIKFVEKNKNDE